MPLFSHYFMDEEAKAYDDKEEYVERPDGNSEEMNNLMDEMTIEWNWD